MTLELPDRDGISLRRKLEQVEKSVGTRDPRLDAVVIPRGVEYLWERFWAICSGQPPTIVETVTYANVIGWKITGYELESIIAMGKEFATVIDERARDRGKE